MMLGPGAPSSFVTCIAWSLPGAIALLSLRAAFYLLLYERARFYLRRRGTGYECYLAVVCEEVWEGLGSSLLLALTGWALYAGHNSHCHLTDTSGCIQGWPYHHRSPSLDALFLMLLAWYLQSTVKHWFGLGRVQGSDVALHHAVTLALLALSYSLDLLRIGLLAHWVFQLTVPLHSVSKLLHCLDIRPLKKPVFYLYAAAFLATRVCLVSAWVAVDLHSTGAGRARMEDRSTDAVLHSRCRSNVHARLSRRECHPGIHPAFARSNAMPVIV